MFTVIQIQRRHGSGRFRQLADRLRPANLRLIPQEVLGCRYQLLRWTGGQMISAAHWQQIGQAAARKQRPVLLPDGILLPEGIPLRNAATPTFDRDVLLRTACEIARRSGLPLYRRILGLIDPTGAMASMLPLLLRYYSCVQVVTDALDLYARASERMMQELGAPVLVGCDEDALGDCMLILTMESAHVQHPARAPILCARGYAVSSPVGIVLGAPEIVPPTPIRTACPEGIAPHRFAAALYEFAGLRDMSLIAASMLLDYRQATLPEVIARLTALLR